MNSFKRILALSLAVLTLSSFTACQVFKSEKETTKLSAEDLMTATDKEGAPVTDFEGNTMNTDAKSEIDEFNKNEEVLSQEGNSTTKSAGTTKNNVVVNGTTGSNVLNGTTNRNPNNPANVTTKNNAANNNNLNNNNNNNSNNNNSNNNNNNNNNNGGESATLPHASYFNTLNQEIFSKGIFTIDGTMSASFENQTMSLPFKLARNGKEQFVRTQYTHENITVGMIINNSKTYLLIPNLKLYQEMEESIFGDADYSGLTDIKSYASTKRVKIGNEIYVCEEIKGSDGYSTFFYFSEETGELKRIKFQDTDGESLLKVSSIKPTVDKSEFAIPKGYKKADIENFG